MIQITEIKKGDQVAYQAVYDLYHAKLFHYFLKRTRIKEQAKDLTQQSFIKLWKSRHTLSDAYSLDTQLFTIASSIFVDHLRKQAAERKYQHRLEDDLCEQPALVCHSNTDYESADYLDAVSEDLPPIRRNVFMLKIAKGYSNKEIAEQLSVSIKTVEDHYSKALKHVRSLVTILLFLHILFSQY
ncbi:RNA polymerase sigma factor [Pseudobacter ginsenosidimutans]|uniref:RNA polymerase sigma (SigX) subunit n=1 Tax=Pseudobacter ginsenosidimutans TaxID=661488 RepID=A0A4Q7N4K9_9BACT|nr:sigma-70 family RNA polymerase sigma factor [Pseudobacter ginsenosidimutans]QEC44480.1 sigma-70 family RNA polymerase sigma factor [Pseudobacter ginsenosidimutans]RZS75952.1 RNA polymerase sigma (SigX) subunit [Pseudobacter ginsenosidimutans]